MYKLQALPVKGGAKINIFEFDVGLGRIEKGFDPILSYMRQRRHNFDIYITMSVPCRKFILVTIKHGRDLDSSFPVITLVVTIKRDLFQT